VTGRPLSFSLRVLLPLLLAATPPLASAASFDCAKAGSVTEKRICADTRLSALDDQLNTAYKAAVKGVKDRAALTADQKKWVAHTRDACADTACLAGAYTTRIAWLKGLDANAGAKCGIDDTAVAGSWSRVHGGDFEEMALLADDGDHGFVSWLHHRPEFTGQWKLDGCVLSIWNPRIPNMDFRYRILKLKDEILYLDDAESGDRSSYKRARTAR
jgi:uncharacterized protein